jgi:hypothetical protein
MTLFDSENEQSANDKSLYKFLWVVACIPYVIWASGDISAAMSISFILAVSLLGWIIIELAGGEDIRGLILPFCVSAAPFVVCTVIIMLGLMTASPGEDF